MEVGKYLENLKTDCVILFLSQMMCGRCSPPCGREGGARLRREAVEFARSGPTGLCFVLVEREDEGRGKDSACTPKIEKVL